MNLFSREMMSGKNNYANSVVQKPHIRKTLIGL